MTKLNTIESNIKAVQATYTKLDKSKLTQDELDLLVENSKEIYEWAVVLRYKAYEEKVFEKSPIIKETEESPISNFQFEETPLSTSEVKEESLSSMQETREEKEQPPFDFSMFDESEERQKQKDEKKTDDLFLPTIQPEENSDKKENATPPPPITIEEEIEKIALENISAPLSVEEKLKEKEAKTAEIKEESGFLIKDLEEPKIPEIKHSIDEVPYTPVDGVNKFVAKFSKVDPSFSSQIGMTKIGTLIGAFGLNERLQYINELFDGSSEAFAEAIKTIDSQTSLEEALAKTSIFADQYHWDIESDTVEELVIKIKRRYA